MTPVPRGVAHDLASAPEVVLARGGLLGQPMWLLASTTSTNDEAKRGARQGAPHGATWVTEQQTAGRGRQGRAWLSPRAESLLFSVLVREAPLPARLPQIALVAGLAVRDAVGRSLPGGEVKIKWPNDVTVHGKKIAGVLVEAITSGQRVEAVVVGVGINVHTRAFSEEIAERATSIALASAPGADPPERVQILADALAALDADLHLVVARGLGIVRARLEAADALRGRRVRSDADGEGVAAGIDEEGRLLVRRSDGVVERWMAGEVHLVG
ncbi:MAG TPA: biotin--[acetyl-CoA-carboxylase] ligase [Polyangiaceae bacterium]|nr:biotin--[acetyl-CoA-carboxylase] ligase [Polyangiaceae bacterium]